MAEEKSETKVKEKAASKNKAFVGIGRRKTAIAKVKLESGSGKVTVNEKELDKYFPLISQQAFVWQPLEEVKGKDKFDVAISTSGGGYNSQAEASRLGIARALIQYNPEWRQLIKPKGWLSRDSRKKERKKYGLKGARRAPQFSKR